MATPEPASAITVVTVLREAAAALAAEGIEDAPRDARLLLGAALGVDQAELILRPDRPLEARQQARFQDMMIRRLRHEPVSRILGEREFYGRGFRVTPATLDPRPDSETLIEAVLAVVDASGGRQRPLRILDIGTGTGCLLLTLLAELPAATGVGIDISGGALEVARENALRIGSGDRARFDQKTASEACDTFDLVISNPPYIPSGEIAALAQDVREYDPHSALDGGKDGLVVYRQIACRLCALVPEGWAFFEVGAGQASAVRELLREAMLQRIKSERTWRDLGGHDRCVAVEIQR